MTPTARSRAWSSTSTVTGRTRCRSRTSRPGLVQRTVTYAAVGERTRRARLTDGSIYATSIATGTLDVHATSLAPTVSLTATPAVAKVGEEVWLVVFGRDPDGGVAAYAFDLDGDGTFDNDADLLGAATRERLLYRPRRGRRRRRRCRRRGRRRRRRPRRRGRRLRLRPRRRRARSRPTPAWRGRSRRRSRVAAPSGSACASLSTAA